MRFKKSLLPAALFFLATAAALLWRRDASAAEGPAVTVYVAPLEGVIGVPMEEYVESVFEGIGKGESAVLVFKMDTPGGLVDSMSQIMSKIADADFPVVVWVGPSGARAASAGAFIAQAAHVAAMAPGTNIGAAHPVTGGGGDIEDSEMNRKVINDLTAKMRSFAQERGRNAAVAESMVTDSVSLTATEAYEQYVIDFIANDERDLMEKLNGREVKIKGRDAVISLDSYEIRQVGMNLRLRALEIFSRPDIAYLALLAGIFLIVLETRAPGGFVMGVTGGVLLLIAAYGLRVLPVNFAGVALLAGGIAVVVIDLFVGGVGILSIAGVCAMLVGGLMMFKAPGGELLNVSAGFIIGATATVALVDLIFLFLVCKTHFRKPTSGIEGLIGERATILNAGEGVPMVILHGEYWRISCDGEHLPPAPGDEVEVVGVSSMTLRVKPAKKE